jgi:hypothetical protein
MMKEITYIGQDIQRCRLEIVQLTKARMSISTQLGFGLGQVYLRLLIDRILFLPSCPIN